MDLLHYFKIITFFIKIQIDIKTPKALSHIDEIIVSLKATENLQGIKTFSVSVDGLIDKFELPCTP